MIGQGLGGVLGKMQKQPLSLMLQPAQRTKQAKLIICAFTLSVADEATSFYCITTRQTKLSGFWLPSFSKAIQTGLDSRHLPLNEASTSEQVACQATLQWAPLTRTLTCTNPPLCPTAFTYMATSPNMTACLQQRACKHTAAVNPCPVSTSTQPPTSEPLSRR